tara:strand:+ start:1033 stop:1713 length:681 start_codon:yes stop_codon:yes gene_type:complete
MEESMACEIYTEDCLDTMDKMNDGFIDLIIADPPYGMQFRSNHRYEKHDEIYGDDNLDWLPAWVEKSYRILKQDTHLYCFCSYHNIEVFKIELQKYFNVKNILIWEKNNTGMGDLKGDYAPKYEMIIFCVKGKRNLNGKRDSNIIYSPRTMNELHPTQKPTYLIRQLISKSSSMNDIVYDPFMGSGTTAVSAIKEKRRWIGSEINKKYVESAYKRIDRELNQLKIF